MSFLKRLVPVKASMQLSLERFNQYEDKPLKGLVQLESRDEFKIECVRLEIRVEEVWTELRHVPSGPRGQGGGNREVRVTKKLYSQDVPVSESFEVGKGDRSDFPFEVKTPVLSPTRGTITHSVKAVANVKGRPDVTKEIQLG